MLFNSFSFIGFFLCVWALYRCLPFKAQNIFLLLASYFFYGCWDWRFLSLLFLSTLVDFYCARKIAAAPIAQKKKIYLLLSLCVNLGALGFFKYFNFFAENLSAVLAPFGLHPDMLTLKIILPVGISFYTFQTLSYTLDVYRQKTKPVADFLDFALYVAFFPQLVAGPIERSTQLLPQIQTPRTVTAQKIKEGLWFVYWGYFLKLFVADNLAQIAALVFEGTGTIPGAEVLLGTYAFAFQIFGDFAGYSFIAIGISKLLGFDLVTNFLFPYFVKTPRDFWRHWHISLSSWLHDYLYIPLGGNKNGALLTVRNLMITMLLGGLWHGAAWTFVIWGFYHGVLLILFRNSKTDNAAKTNQGFKDFLQIFFMFQLTCFGWLIFRAQSPGQLWSLIQNIFLNIGAASPRLFYFAVSVLFYAAPLLGIQLIQKRKNNLAAIPYLRGARPWIIYLIMFYLLIFFGEYGGKEFIYFQF